MHDMTFGGTIDGDAGTHDTMDQHIVKAPGLAAIAPTGGGWRLGNTAGVYAVFVPKGMSCTLKLLPYRLDDVRGRIRVTPQKITVENLTARRDGVTLRASGTGTVGANSIWNLRISGRDVVIDDELRRALPPALQSVVDAIKLRGKIDIDFPKFVYRGEAFLVEPAASAPAMPKSHDVAGAVSSPSSVAEVSPAVDIDLSSAVTIKGVRLEAGVPMTDAFGTMRLDAAVAGQGFDG